MLPENYRAWIWHGENLPSGLRLETLPLPHPNIGQVLVRNEAIGLNPVDWKLLNIKIGEIPGVDGAGTIVSVGPGVTSHWIGQRVAWHQSLQKSGSFAEYTLLDVNIMLRIPPKVDSIVAAALPCPGLTAWQALEKIPYRSGDHLLISGAGGSVGHYLLQLACQRGFVVDTLSHPRHHTKLSALGASHCYATPGNAASWAAQTQYNAIIDASSPDSHSWLCRALAANGHFVAILGRPENWPCEPFTHTFSLHEVALGALHIYGTPLAWQRLTADGERLLEQIATGTLISEELITFKFDALADYLFKLEQRNFSGKLVAEI